MSRQMDQRYGFRASKRMFDARFKSWAVQKNLRRADKDRLAQGMTRADSVSANDRKKVMRYLSAQQRRSRSKSIPSTPGEGERKDLSEQSSPYTLGRLTPSSEGQSVINGSLTIEAITSPQTVPVISRQSPGAYNPVGVEIPVPNQNLESLSLQLTITAPFGAAATTDPNDEYVPITRQLSSRAADRNGALLWDTMGHFINSKVQNVLSHATPDMVLGEGASDLSRSFWNKVENGIYLLKIGDSEGLAVPALNDAGRLLQFMFQSGQVSLDFLRKLLYTLSPTNTTTCPQRRNSLLESIRKYAGRDLGVDHPISVICNILLVDEESAELSRRALFAMYQMMCDSLDKTHEAPCKVMDSVITLARRSGQQELRTSLVHGVTKRSDTLDSAMRLAEQAYELAKTYNNRPDQTRQAAYTLAELCTVADQKDRANKLRREIIMQNGPGLMSSSSHEDVLSAYTMECIAESHEKENDFQGAMLWLEQAHSIASKIWEPSNVSRMYISKKLETAKLDIACARLDLQPVLV
ncbi:hypothetical protein DOTSEDRAFT_69344 [Dothistroma septosporum NZE10]|uniref:Clr5 domain-containing protein n=1 Tax=Dothistroma septosporum (strain NZE10 / CBS 128990) TaxID=675120 RepID=N1PV73_DOTSN|nr:hypothetical protein DOTSEDRAFT_69344 [Dothistroma septosporum NZE10]